MSSPHWTPQQQYPGYPPQPIPTQRQAPTLPPAPPPIKAKSTKWKVIAAGVGGLILGIMIGSSGHSSTPTSASAATTPRIAAAVPTAPAAPADGPLASLSPGTYEVGKGAGQVAPGKYKSTGPDGSNGAGCYYSRLKSNDGSINDILGNDVSQGPSILTVKPSDGFVQVVGCTFTKA